MVILPADMLVVMAAPFIGSFVTMLAHRLPAGAPIAIARSACPQCGTALSPWSLVPILSWAVQRGRCRHCNGAISPSYPLIEFAALALAVWALSVVTGWVFAASCILGWALLALAVIDTRHFILPDSVTLPLIAAGLAVTLFIDQDRVLPNFLAAMAAGASLALISELYRALRGREGLGLGDAKLFAAGGAWVGFAGLPGVILIGCFAALAWALVQCALRRKISGDMRLAFGPFLALGIWVIWLYGPLEMGWGGF
jgi:leader peptidase (prepilin peptidase) / N-methyltransferase